MVQESGRVCNGVLNALLDIHLRQAVGGTYLCRIKLFAFLLYITKQDIPVGISCFIGARDGTRTHTA